MANSDYVGIVRVKEDLRKDGNWVLTSKDLPGLLLCGNDVNELREDTPTAIKALYKLNYDMDVVVHMAGHPINREKAASGCVAPTHQWAAVPAQAA